MALLADRRRFPVTLCVLIALFSGTSGQANARAWKWDSVGSFCRSLQGRAGCRIGVARGLDDLGMIHSPCATEPADAMVARIARLTGSVITTDAADASRPAYSLIRQRSVSAREEIWRTEPVRLFLAEHVRRASVIGDAAPGEIAPDTDFYLRRRYARIALRYAGALSPPQVAELLDGGEVRLGADVVVQEARRVMLGEFYGSDRALPEDQIRAKVEATDAAIQAYGVGLKLDSSGLLGTGTVLSLSLGPPRSVRSSTIGLAHAPADSLAIPLTRRSPYEFLEAGVSEPTPTGALPLDFHQRLSEDLRMPPDGSWRQMVNEFGRVTGLPFLSDDYLSRDASLRPMNAGADAVGKKGQVVAEVLDEMCRRFQYVWWHDRGWCYFRSNRWPHDVAREVPAPVLSRCAVSLQASGRLSPRDLGEIAALPTRKVEGLGRVRLDGAKAPEVWPAALNEFFVFVAALSPAQRQSFVQQGLEVPVPADLPLEIFRKLRRGPRADITLGLLQEAREEPKSAIPGWSVALIPRAIADGGKTEIRTTFKLAFPSLTPCCR